MNPTLDPNEAHRLMGVIDFLESLKRRPSYYALHPPYTDSIDRNLNRVWQRVVKHTQPFLEKSVLSVPGVHLTPTHFS